MFNWLTNIFEQKDAPTVGWAALVDASIQTAAGITVSPTTALKCTPVLAGITVRAQTLGSLPIHLYQRNPDGGKDRATDHPLHRLLHDRPNPWTSAAGLVVQLEMDAILHGSGFAVAVRAGGDKIIELIRLEPTSVACESDQASEPRYSVTLKGGGQRVYGWQDILHVPALGGLSVIKQSSDAIGLYMALEKHGARIFGNGGRPSGILKYGKRLTKEGLERLRERWTTNHAGDASGKTAVLEDGVEFEPLTFSSVDLQFQELRAFQLVEIARSLGVPPMLIMDFGRATWSNSEQMAQAFLTFTILPRIKVWQGAISRLLSAADQAKYFPEFLVDELVKAAIAERFQAYAVAATNGILSPNEIRSMENRPPYPGGDEFRLPMNTEQPGQPDSTPTKKPRAIAA